MKKVSEKAETPETESEKPDLKKANLKADAWQISTILLEAQESLKILEYLVKEDPDTDVYIKHLDLFWRFTTSIYSDHVLLKLNILFTPEEHFSIDRLLKNLKEDGLFHGIILESKIDEWVRIVASKSVIYKKISARRNKEIAHKDKKPNKRAKADITFIELKTLVTIVQEIVKEIYWVVTKTSLQFESPLTGAPLNHLKAIIKILDEKRREELGPLFVEARMNGLDGELPISERTAKETK